MFTQFTRKLLQPHPISTRPLVLSGNFKTLAGVLTGVAGGAVITSSVITEISERVARAGICAGS